MPFSYAVIQLYSVFLGILLCSFESCYSLLNSVIHFSGFMMPLYYAFFNSVSQFYYSLLNSVMQFSNSIIGLYSPLMQFRILLFPLKFCYSLFQFYYPLSNYVLPNPGPRLFGRRCPRDQFQIDKDMADLEVDVLRNRLGAWISQAILQQLNSPNFESDSHDSVFYHIESLYNTVAIATDNNIVSQIRLEHSQPNFLRTCGKKAFHW